VFVPLKKKLNLPIVDHLVGNQQQTLLQRVDSPGKGSERSIEGLQILEQPGVDGPGHCLQLGVFCPQSDQEIGQQDQRLLVKLVEEKIFCQLGHLLGGGGVEGGQVLHRNKNEIKNNS
jgi:hypothetical protein